VQRCVECGMGLRLTMLWREDVGIDGQMGRTYQIGQKRGPFNNVVAQTDIIKMGPVLARHERCAMLEPLSRPVVRASTTREACEPLSRPVVSV
jgi:hypothetical protein